jgi:4'-phosphopantetheinyl transferase
VSEPAIVQVWTLRVDALDEAEVAPWLGMLDPIEQARAARFVFARDRAQFVAAHALARAALSALVDHPPASWRFVAAEHGKPSAWFADASAPVSFNLSHTNGMVGVAVTTLSDHDLGFDVEPLARKISLAVADRFFRPEEIAWLGSLPELSKSDGFLRLWTLKEAFLKATGKGLTQDLATFWFDVFPPQIHFAPVLLESEAGWHFEQRVVGDDFIAAVGLRRPAADVETQWTTVGAADISAEGFIAKKKRGPASHRRAHSTDQARKTGVQAAGGAKTPAKLP